MKGDRIRQVREISNLTQAVLAERLDITQAALAQIEAGLFSPSDAHLSRISFETGFDPAYLKRDDAPIEFPSPLYRSQAKVGAKDKSRAHRLSQLFFEVVTHLKGQLSAIPVLLPRLSADPESAAKITRNHLSLSPDTPLLNLMSVLERAGVLIFHLPMSVEGFDGFSVWVGNTPVICLVGAKLGYRHRFTLGEETGHLVMHNPLRVSIEEADDEAKLFAGEFLIPAEALRRELSTAVTLTSLSALKPRWQASCQFLARRAKDIGAISPNQYKYLMQQMSARGWRSSSGEPGDDRVPQEYPRAVKKMIQVLYGETPDWARLRRETGVPLRMLKAMYSPANSNIGPASIRVLGAKLAPGC